MRDTCHPAHNERGRSTSPQQATQLLRIHHSASSCPSHPVPSRCLSGSGQSRGCNARAARGCRPSNPEDAMLGPFIDARIRSAHAWIRAWAQQHDVGPLLQRRSLHRHLGSGRLQLLLHRLRVRLGHPRLDHHRRLLHQLFSLLQAEASERADFLDDLDFPLS